MKIAIVGCGALGSYYGAKLNYDGHETWFLARSDFEAIRRAGVRVTGASESFTTRPKCAQSPSAIGVCDLVIIGLKTTANDQFAHLLPPLVGPSTAILTLQNGLGNEEDLARLFPVPQILGGLCFVSLNRIGPAEIRHINGGRILMGEHLRWPEPRTHDIASAFRHAGVPCDVTDNLARAHWLKLVWNIAFNGLGVASAAGLDAVLQGEVPASSALGPCLPTNELLGSSLWLPLVREVMLEVIAAANALNLKIEPDYADREIERTRGMGVYYASTLVDFERGSPLELKSLFLEPLRLARESQVPVPRLDALARVLVSLDRLRGTGAKSG